LYDLPPRCLKPHAAQVRLVLPMTQPSPAAGVPRDLDAPMSPTAEPNFRYIYPGSSSSPGTQIRWFGGVFEVLSGTAYSNWPRNVHGTNADLPKIAPRSLLVQESGNPTPRFAVAAGYAAAATKLLCKCTLLAVGTRAAARPTLRLATMNARAVSADPASTSSLRAMPAERRMMAISPTCIEVVTATTNADAMATVHA
jgi:hypothetical protein